MLFLKSRLQTFSTTRSFDKLLQVLVIDLYHNLSTQEVTSGTGYRSLS
jgi:hypothetical protein